MSGSTTREQKNYRTVIPSHKLSNMADAEKACVERFKGNYIKTTKYSIWTFLPKNLYEQFHRFANLYFILVLVLEFMPFITAFVKELAVLPVIFVLSVTALKDMYEYFRRNRSDNKLNSTPCRVWGSCKNCTQAHYVKSTWSKILVGDFIHLGCNERIPADMLLLTSANRMGLCYVETSNLDGESNLKQRQVVASLQRKQDQLRETKDIVFKPTDFQSNVQCEKPNPQLDHFSGKIMQENGQEEPLNRNNILLRGCMLRNTDFVEGIVLYTGHDTKAMMNNSGPRYKRSSLEQNLNRDVKWCIGILLVLCLVGATGSALWVNSYSDNPAQIVFLMLSNAALSAGVNFLSYIIVLQSMIPLSLYVTLEFIKLGQILFITLDKNLYYKDSQNGIECHALNIPEELGQIQYVLSDKTGTLTENKMIFKRCAIGGIDFGPSFTGSADTKTTNCSNVQGSVEQGTANSELQTIIHDAVMRQEDTSHYSTELYKNVNDFLIGLAVCNTVMIASHEHKDNITQSGSSAPTTPVLNCTTPTPSTSVTSLDAGSLPESVNYDLSPASTFHPSASTPSFQEKLSKMGRKLKSVTSFVWEGKKHDDCNRNLRQFYEGESPDELCLVYAAKSYGYTLHKRHVNYVTVKMPDGITEIKYDLLHILEFDANRKRMSVILKKSESNDGPILFCKGADSAIMELLSQEFSHSSYGENCIEKCEEYLNTYSCYGLRTLCITKKEYDSWLKIRREAELSVENREEKLSESALTIEKDLELLGVTGIEDRLQDGVPDCIKSLREAGIRIWILTGDKVETAVSVAYACQLFSNDMELIKLTGVSKECIAEKLVQLLLGDHSSVNESCNSASTCSKRKSGINNQKRIGLVIDGKTLSYCLNPETDENFVKLVSKCSSVLCCRTTPIQKEAKFSYVIEEMYLVEKANMVKVVKGYLKAKTLAIGDGANDVSMIQTADVGVGINGQEGMQAVMASDYSLPRFRFLKRLILVHGHWCYERLVKIMQYFFFANSLFVFALLWFQIYCGFTAQTTVDPFYLVLYSVFFTSLPPVIIGTLDQTAPDNILEENPHLYCIGRNSMLYGKLSFWISIVNALWQSLAIFYFTYYVYNDTDIELWSFGFVIFTAVVMCNESFLALEVKCWTWPKCISIVISVVCYLAFALVYNEITSPDLRLPDPPVGVAQMMMKTLTFHLTLIFIIPLAIFPKFAVRIFVNSFSPSPVLVAQLKSKVGGKPVCFCH